MRSLLLLPFLALLVSSVSARAKRSAEEEDAFLAHFDAYNNAIKATEDRWAGLSASDLCTGDNDCCTAENQCGLGEGDCDNDDDCLSGLVCGEPGNCNGGVKVPTYASWTVSDDAKFSGTDACCELPSDVLGSFFKS